MKQSEKKWGPAEFAIRFRPHLEGTWLAGLTDQEVEEVWKCLLYDVWLHPTLLWKHTRTTRETLRALLHKRKTRMVAGADTLLKRIANGARKSPYSNSLKSFPKAAEALLAVVIRDYAKETSRRKSLNRAKKNLPLVIEIAAMHISMIFWSYFSEHSSTPEARFMLVASSRREDYRNIAAREMGNNQEKLLRSWLKNKKTLKRITADYELNVAAFKALARKKLITDIVHRKK